MSINCSFSINVSLPADHQSSLYIVCRLFHCFNSTLGAYIINSFIFTNVFVILPLCVFILSTSLKECLQGSNRKTSNSDLFTYHMVAMELINVFAFMATFCGIHAKVELLTMMGISFLPINFCGQLIFHTLTCIERYLAVVHPLTFMSLKNKRNIRVRNAVLVCVWLLTFSVLPLLSVMGSAFTVIVSYCYVPMAITTMSFCSISILCTLIHPKPGDRGRDTHRVDPVKLRALCTIMVILGVLLFRFGGNILATSLDRLVPFQEKEKCGILMCDFFYSLPCSLVLPLLFLHKRKKIKCC